ncbi:sensor histidine kinase [Thalassospira profundimaris]|uniref:sensor histidine kinase n=1 Tax=Thalassospira profundimaris TaxID=502049 RepID=UPI0002873E6A|nr:ATP-binding protein [Thalassospira profundimaris]EKF10429.1 C4-dicarboxylate transport regulating signal transduction histidine kinase [Thalassospira profundimaris WP0211]
MISTLVVWLVVSSTGNLTINELHRTAQARLALYDSSLRAAVDQYRYLPYVVARHHEVIAAITGTGNPRTADMYLERVKQRSGAAALYVMDKTGMTVAASNWNTPDSFVGEDYGFRPYFSQSITGGEGFFFGIGVTTGRAGLFISNPIRGDDEIIGVAVVKIELDEVESNWQGGGETVFVADEDGVITMTSRGDWKYRTLSELSPEVRGRIVRHQQYPGKELASLDIGQQLAKGTGIVTINSERFLFDDKHMQDSKWRLYYLTSMDYVSNRQAAALFIAVSGAGLIILIILFLRERELKLASQREAREFARIQALNIRLEEEIAVRRKTEEELRGTQNELVQAGKLAALGQMSAAIAHEINQPITAIRTFCASAKLMLERGKTEKLDQNINQISALTERMGAITGQLKTFSRKSTGVLEPVDLKVALDNTLQLLSPQLQQEECTLERNEPDTPLVIQADLVRIEQICVNIIRNALDAMADSSVKRIRIDLTSTKTDVIMQITDTGPGMNEETLSLLFDPFFTTKDPGQGVGLGLSVTYGIVRDFGGSIKAYNTETAGACFEVRLPLLKGKTP